MIKKSFAAPALVALLALALGAFAQAGERFSQGLLWQIERGPDEGPHWIHAIAGSFDPRVTTLPQPVLTALRQANRLIVEVLPQNSWSSFSQQTDTRQMAFIGRGEADLEERLDPASYAFFKDRVVLPFGFQWLARRYKVQFAAITVSIPETEMQFARTGAPFSLQVLLREARMPEDQRVSLETSRDQIRAILSIHEDNAIYAIRYFMRHRNESDRSSARQMDLYARGEIGKMRTESIRIYRAAGLGDWLENVWFDGRVKRTAASLERKICHCGTFVAIQAELLAGDNGLLALLEDQGWTITRRY